MLKNLGLAKQVHYCGYHKKYKGGEALISFYQYLQ